MTTADENGAAAPKDFSLITLGSGSDFYFDIAINLARSFEHWNPKSPAFLYIVTDLTRHLPADLKKTRIIKCDPGYLKRGFSAKIQMYEYAPTDEFLFIDADCLILGDISPVIQVLSRHDIGIFGVEQVDGERFGVVPDICRNLDIPFVPNFNGGLYYVRKSPLAQSIFAYALALEPRYDEVGFVRLRGQPNEEMLIGAGLAKFGVQPVANPGAYYADFQWWPKLVSLDALKGVCELRNPPAPDPLHQDSYPADVANPVVLHFLGHHIRSPEYKQAALAFSYASRGALGATIRARIETWPLRFLRSFKNLARPAFRALFGARKVREERQRLVVR